MRAWTSWTKWVSMYLHSQATSLALLLFLFPSLPPTQPGWYSESSVCPLDKVGSSPVLWMHKVHSVFWYSRVWPKGTGLKARVSYFYFFFVKMLTVLSTNRGSDSCHAISLCKLAFKNCHIILPSSIVTHWSSSSFDINKWYLCLYQRISTQWRHPPQHLQHCHLQQT